MYLLSIRLAVWSRRPNGINCTVAVLQAGLFNAVVTESPCNT